jgi:hypothetical protein
MELVVLALTLFFLAAFEWFVSRHVERRVVSPEYRREQGPGSIDGYEYLPVASCSADLLMRLKEIDVKGSRWHFIGWDGSYFETVAGRTLKNLLATIVNSGGTVEYLLLKSSKLAEEQLIEIARSHSGKVVPLFFDWTAASEAAKSLALQRVTYHPTFFETDNGVGLWVEREHSEGSQFAYGVDFYTPDGVSGSEPAKSLSEKLRADFEVLRNNSKRSFHLQDAGQAA